LGSSSVDAYLDRLAHGGNDFDEEGEDFRPLRAISIRHRRLEIQQFASALVHCGHDPQPLTGLADLVPIAVVKKALRFFLDRTPGKTGQAARMAYIIRTIAKYWTKVEPDHLEALSKLWRKLDEKPEGLTQKNRERLRQFDDPAGVEKLVSLPQTLIDAAKKARTPRKAALLIQSAVAIEILSMAPVRIKNLAGIEIGRHLLSMGDTQQTVGDDGKRMDTLVHRSKPQGPDKAGLKCRHSFPRCALTIDPGE
jgi:hypothetical protein